MGKGVLLLQMEKWEGKLVTGMAGFAVGQVIFLLSLRVLFVYVCVLKGG